MMRYLLFVAALTVCAADRIVVIGDAKVAKRYEAIAVPASEKQFPPAGVAYRDNTTGRHISRTIHSLVPNVLLTATPRPSPAAARAGHVPVVGQLPRKVAPLALTLERGRRLRRAPQPVAGDLSKVYGQELKEVVYIPAFAVLARKHLGQDSLAKATTARQQTAADQAIAKGAMYNEMSGSVFMGCPLPAHAGGPAEALTYLAFMQKLCPRADALYRQSRLDEAAWGRAKSGLCRQVIDPSTADGEFPATAMIAASIHIRLREGRLKGPRYGAAVERAWGAIKARTGNDGGLMDVYESTGKQPKLDASFRRAAIWHRNPRGGAMALLPETELLRP